MQVLTLIKAVAIALSAGSLSFLLTEWRFYRSAFARSQSLGGQAPDTGRLVRRAFGSAILLTMSVLLFLGELPQPGKSTPEEVLQLFYYWSAIAGLALILGCTALYDAARGVKQIGSYVSVLEGRELATLAKQLKLAELDGELLGEDALEKG